MSGSWANLPLGQICTVVSGATPRRDVPHYWATNGSGIPWVTPKDLSDLDGKILEDTPEYISKEGFRSCSTAMLPKGSLLLSSRAPIGLLAVTGRNMCTNQGFKSLVPNADVSVDYLYYALLKSVASLQNKGRGATFKEVNKTIVEEFEVPIPLKKGKPDLAEQKRIAAILDKADAIRRKRQQALALTDDLLRSTFLEMFGDPVTNPKEWPLESFDSLVAETKLGISRGAQEIGPERAYRYLKMDALRGDGFLDVSKAVKVDASEKEVASARLEYGDFLFNTRNSKELVGKTALFLDRELYLFNNNIMRVRFKEGIDPFFMNQVFLTPYVQHQLEIRKSGTTSVFAIYYKNLATVEIPVPDPDQQQRFRAFAESLIQKQARLRKTMMLDEQLFASCLQRAFRGEL